MSQPDSLAGDAAEQRRQESETHARSIGLESRYFDLYDLAPAGYCTVGDEESILEANLTAARLLGVSKDSLVRQRLTSYILPGDEEIYRRQRNRLFATGEPQTCELRMRKQDHTVFWALLQTTLARDSGGVTVCRIVISDVTRQKFEEHEHSSMERLLLQAAAPGDFRQLMSSLIASLQSWSGCDAVGIRLRDGDDYSFYETRGLPFASLQQGLCAYGEDNPVLECMCADVLYGRFDRSQPFFTDQGSFWSNHITALLASTAEGDRTPRMRSECNCERYESVALVPLRADDRIFGLLQFCNHRPDCFTSTQIGAFERIAGGLAVALSRRQSEETLRRSQEEMKAVYEHASMMMCVEDSHLRVLYANPAFRTFTGASEDDLKNRGVCSVFGCANAEDGPDGGSFGPNCDDCAIRLALEDTLRTGTGHSSVEQHVTLVCHKERREVDLMCSTALIPRTGPSHLLLCLQDVTERKRTLEALRDSEERLSLALEVGSLGIWEWNLKSGVVHFGPRFSAMLGYKPDELPSLIQDWLPYHHPDELPVMLARVEAYLRGDSPIYESEHRIRTKSGNWCWVFTRGRCVDSPSGNPPERFIGIAMDITGRKRAEEEKAKLEARFHQAQKMETIGRLAGGVAHDFNNLLTVINGYSQFGLAKMNEADPLRPYLVEIHKAGNRAAGLTRQLLAYSRKQILKPSVLDLNSVLLEMEPMLERLMGEDVEVRFALDPGTGTVCADQNQLEQVVMNLAVNARDAMPDGGRLSIETTVVERDESYARVYPEARPGRYVMLAVSDSGVGMNEETRQRIFEPFFTTKDVGQGTGLGLSMVQGVVEQSGGHIEVSSQPGRGAEFRICLPALAEVAPGSVRPAAVPAPGGKETVLVVEDQEAVCEYVVEALKAYGYRVLQARSVSQALALCEREHGCIHMVLTDVVMPNGNGRELANRLKDLRPETKVLFMSGYTDNVMLHYGDLEENLEFVQKPFTPQALAAKVRKVLGPPEPPPG